MDDEWSIYLFQRDEKRGYVLYNAGIQERINDIDVEDLLTIQFSLKAPDDNGFPTHEERDTVEEMRDFLAERIEALKGHFVGHVTFDGFVSFHYYAPVTDESVSPILDAFRLEHDYEAAYRLAKDPEKKFYWELLCPNELEEQTKNDLMVIAQLQVQGDCLEEARKIDHFVTFDSLENLQTFLEWAEEEGFQNEGYSEPDEEYSNYYLQISHVATPDLGTITQYRAALMEKTRSLDGGYDGWGTIAVVDAKEKTPPEEAGEDLGQKVQQAISKIFKGGS